MDERAGRREREPDSTLAEGLDALGRRVATGLVLGGAAIALAIYARPGPPRYQALETETGIVRVDTRSGAVLHCVANGCYTVVRRGQTLLDDEERRKAREKAFGEDAPAAKALSPPAQSQPATPADVQ